MARRLVAALWILALPALLWATVQSAPSEHRFRTLVAQYRGGDAKAAIAELAQWDAKRLKDEAVIGLDEPVLTLAGAALLHLEAALQRGAALPGGMRSVDRSLDVAYPLVQAVARRSRDNPALRDFSRNWYICALSMCLQRRGTWFYGYYPLLLSAQTEFPNDPRILVTAASGATPQCIGCSELCGTERDTAQGLPSDWNIEDATRKVFHQSAEQLLRKALAVDPGLVEARVRLGRLLQTNGRLEESRIELERARDEAINPSLVYLAALFLGRTHEEAGRFDKARASVPSSPSRHCQPVRLAIWRSERCWCRPGEPEKGGPQSVASSVKATGSGTRSESRRGRSMERSSRASTR